LGASKTFWSQKNKPLKKFKIFEETDNDLKLGIVWTSNRNVLVRNQAKKKSGYRTPRSISRKVSSSRILKALIDGEEIYDE
jgi:hypothetical protein